MIGSTGGAVCVLVTVMGLYMVIHATRRIESCGRTAVRPKIK